MPAPSATTRVFALLGDPVAHSLSPTFQNAAIHALDLDAVYVALRCDAASVGPLVRALARAGGGGNVTVPHKAAAAICLDHASDDVRRTGACNTFWGVGDEVHGDNTDVEGFRLAARELVGDLAGARVLVVGAGGAASAALAALLDERAATVTLFNRSPDRALALAARMNDAGAAGSPISVVTSVFDLRHEEFDLLVNASSAGLSDDDPLPLPLEAPRRVRALLDLVYRPAGATPFVRAARDAGIPAADGLGMLLGQGAAAFQRWFRQDAPVAAMRAALGRR